MRRYRCYRWREGDLAGWSEAAFATARLCDHAGTGHSEGEAHGPDCAEGDRARGGKNGTAFSDRTIVQLDVKDAEKKRDKWREIAIEACKQCGQNRLPEIAVPRSPRAFFEKQEPSELMLIARAAGARRTRACWQISEPARRLVSSGRRATLRPRSSPWPRAWDAGRLR